MYRHLNLTLPDDFVAGNLQKTAKLHSTTVMEKNNLMVVELNLREVLKC